jgi:hypothetical protein
MEYPSYLIHFNRNHSPKNGQFTSGDGDGDGASDERGRHGRYKPEAIGTNGNQSSVSIDGNDFQQKVYEFQQKAQKFAIKGGLKLSVKAGTWITGKAFVRTKLGKQYNQIKKDWISVGKYTLANTDFNKAMKDSNWSNYRAELNVKKNRFTNKIYDKAAGKLNNKLNEYLGG